MHIQKAKFYLIPLLVYILVIKFAVLGSLVETVGQFAVIGIILGMLVIIPLWSQIKISFRELKWHSIFYAPSLLIAQVATFLIIYLIATKIGHIQVMSTSANQSNLNGMGTYASKNILVGILFFIFTAVIGPMVENVLFLYFIQGTVLVFATKKLPKKLGITIRIVITALLFTLWHMTHLSDLGHPMFYEYLSLIWLSVIYEYQHSLAKTWIAHAGLNTVSAIIMLT
ncbi:hypothetical protein FC70_GL000154 [Paucilactobacillus oligofermentans DSM 15707 = LMG 22743]|uniref:CAAX prenyl protease 2/Lysostaphin resistance protein A-like domain-containing protein n=1 Tax=Paucilactobacillus oligofermentans DSM 15707 = LMG 22743 TaxID=1423778 RepID=A0A0R1RN81_9LACO|nr:CPBP family intramembrane glutamic endopeptidase [Paucilactobacillus oligofermentans]KRL58081.1 hypothetical protein FC70_GL000154 [Paucilactobacillus oligofermentans DSM 15707 = LMG 22743]CUS26989.1 CAAX protease self-immunity protein [Paucilactobacillus oligofermentans DSM 15707 = LMG 22743]